MRKLFFHLIKILRIITNNPKIIFYELINLFKRISLRWNRISSTAIIHNKKLVKYAKHTQITEYVIIRAHTGLVIIGDYSQIGPFTVIFGGSGVQIGDNVMIAPHCVIASGIHDYKQLDKPMRFAGSYSKGPIIIEDDVWIGANCTITDGVHISKGVVVAANSVVTKDVKEFNIVAGNPAKVIGNRKMNNIIRND